MEDRIMDLETKMAYQDTTIKELSDVIYEQQKTIDTLNEKIDLLLDRYRDISKSIGEVRDEKPPHY
ncbi:MAG: SlyX family protein [Desulfobacterales bacterium]|nr:SlyX family protein [Desulfobacterales bacterium]MCP4163861.1 SlyX family protein [Deltaproteobacteria bacterium]